MKEIPRELISICIPTYKRPDLLRLALDSCFAQTYTDIEIVIGDDSPDDASERVAVEYDLKRSGVIRYQHNRPSLGQNDNVNDLFQRASGDRLVLLHDDDLLLPKAVELLVGCWNNVSELDAAFGKQRMITITGSILSQESTDALNQGYHRIAANQGRQKIPVAAGILQMFPQ